ncbi:MAG TPA: UTP--glucose-1-phosphate uridylyltransferase GalU [Ktedonobacterales bacterium]|jgi:UTP--glucose-1-phosphate uridylyltransferase
MPIKKAVITAAGLGTRVLPATKAVPKEMLPLADAPTIQYIAEEAVASGISSITFITSRTKRAVEDHFDDQPELREVLERKGDAEKLARVNQPSELAHFSFVRQAAPLGMGHAVLMARPVIGEEPFGLLLGDDVIVHQPRPCLRQLIDVHERTGASVIAVMRVPREMISRYGVVTVDPAGQLDARTFRVLDTVEKPRAEDAPSDLAVIGRYVFTPRIFDLLEVTAPGAGGEIQLTDAISALAEREPVYAYEFEGTRYDIGDPVGLLTTSLAFALMREDLAPGVKAYLRTLKLD